MRKRNWKIFTLVFVFLCCFSSATVLAEWNVQHPTQSDHVLRAVWGTASDNVFAAGARSFILHYDGTRWERMQAGTTRQIRDLYGVDASNVYAVGVSGVMLRYDGTMWSDISGPATNGNTYHGVWANSATDVFAVGSRGSIVHWDGSQRTAMDSPTSNTLQRVWGTSATNGYAGGSGSVLLHYDGVSWKPMRADATASLDVEYNDVWGSSGSDVFAVGNGGKSSITAETFGEA